MASTIKQRNKEANIAIGGIRTLDLSKSKMCLPLGHVIICL